MAQLGMNQTPLYPFTTALVVTVHTFDLIVIFTVVDFLLCTSALLHHASIIYKFSIRIYFCRYFLVFLVASDMGYCKILNPCYSSSSLSLYGDVANFVFL